jgi:thymidine phosphorylase
VPLGRACGNALEVTESIETFQGRGPADLVDITLALAREMVALAGLEVDPARVLADGRAFEVWEAMVRAQGGDPTATRPVAAVRHEVRAPTAGYLRRLDARAVGIAVWRLGAGRSRKEDPVHTGAGVRWHARPGDTVTEGQPLMTLLTDEPDRFERALAALEGAYDVSADASYTPGQIVLDRVG